MTMSVPMGSVGSMPFQSQEPATALDPLKPPKPIITPKAAPKLPAAGSLPELTTVYKCEGTRRQFNVTTLVKDSFARTDNPNKGYQICTYDLRQLVWFGGFIAGNARGSIFRDAPDIKSWLLWQASLFIIGTIIFALAAPDGDINLEGIDNLESYLNSIVPLLVGLYLEVSLWRWWALRCDACGNLCDCITEITSLASCFIPHEGLTQDVRFNVARWSMASLFLIKEAARGRDSKTTAECAIKKGVLTEQEVAVFEDVHPYVRSMVMWSWIARAVNDNLMKSTGPEPFSNFGIIALNVCIRARNALQVLHTYMSTALPFSYVHLVSLTVDVTTFVIGLKCSLVCANALGEDPRNWQVFVYEVLHVLFVPMMYHGLLSVTYIIHDPFGEELADFPMSLFMENQSLVTAAMRKGDERFPRRDLNKLQRLAGNDIVKTPSAENVQQDSKAVTSSREVARQAAAHIMADVTQETLKKVRGSLTGFAKELNLLVEEVAMADAGREQATEHLTALVETFTELDNQRLAAELRALLLA
mmetsp:Transcript_91481/g.175408  ORF Transcript_91481/g.175408 Transcript_91481/m.175408 type:complete len:531 (+) Transcript_91481:2-1594(+)